VQTYIYQCTSELNKLIDEKTEQKINNAKSVLIQLFSGEQKERIKVILNDLTLLFPNAFIITTTTDGEIAQNKVLEYSSVIAISTFENTTFKIAFSNQEDSYSVGRELAQKTITHNTKLIISFANGLLCNGDEFLHGMYSINEKFVIAGGLSADNGEFKRCYVGIGNDLYDTGAVAVSLNSDVLQVQNMYSFGWNAIGVKHKITKAIKNRVYTIDNMSAFNFYKKYLGEDIAQELPKTGIEFPLIIDEQGFKKARAVTAIHEDESLSFAGNITTGEDVYIGIGEVTNILSNKIENIYNISVESFFIYSCMARRRFIPNLIHEEIEPFANIAPTSGFFTYGEFFTDSKPKLLNQTMTAIALSESDKMVQKKDSKKKKFVKNKTFKALLHIIDVTSKELHEQTLKQERISKKLAAKNDTLRVIQDMSNLASWELDLNTLKISWSSTSYKIFNMDPKNGPPTYSEFLDMILPEDRKKLISTQKQLEDGKIHSIEIQIKRNDDKILTLLESGKLIFENNQPIKIVGTTLDITEIRMRDAILVQQSKSAQMGEMINMIAHQWRQPLNAISSASIKLGIQSDMDILTKDEISKTVNFIEEMTQKMSQTINDFMEFNKPTNKKEHINFNEIVQDILKIMGTQLTNHNIILETSIEAEPKIFTYKKELEHVLINLIANARDALEEHNDIEKKIAISVYRKDTHCIIKVSDNAGGLDDNVIDRIFDPYFTTKDSNKGTGLGLYMSKKILKEHLGGDIFVRNHKAGAEFTIMLDINNE